MHIALANTPLALVPFALAPLVLVPLGLSAAPARAEAPPEVLPMTAELRRELARIYEHDHNPGHYHDLVVEERGAHYGRIGNRYYAVLSLWYRDSPTKNTDAGTAFTASGPKRHWAVSMVDGAYDPCARPAPERLMRAWGMRVAKCSGAGARPGRTAGLSG
ncbi:hypothetical protein [Actinomadura rubrisoli]|uniref:Uncharacterized protein n=1 Tax=Actinomadura rubrisoli TaxID=2530368 RepID=A0A4R5C9X3_9ACTN|nr:hypothetical protein [Actinomadura rubrisoli]TDD94993.1 hypothetical protein E1298_06005 [Actinomadura rubrisoli]